MIIMILIFKWHSSSFTLSQAGCFPGALFNLICTVLTNSVAGCYPSLSCGAGVGTLSLVQARLCHQTASLMLVPHSFKGSRSPGWLQIY